MYEVQAQWGALIRNIMLRKTVYEYQQIRSWAKSTQLNSCLLYVMHLQRYTSTYRGTAVRGGALRPLRGCQMQTLLMCHIWTTGICSAVQVLRCRAEIQFQLLHCCTALLIKLYLSNILLLPGVLGFFRHHTSNYSTSTLPTSGGGEYLTPPPPSNIIPASI